MEQRTMVVWKAVLSALVALLLAGPALPARAAQEASGARPSATAIDSAALVLLDRARAARGREADGLDAYEALVRERLYVGLTASSLRRERGLFRSERVARVRWERSGVETIRWLGIRRDVPIAGRAAKSGEGPPDELESYPLDPTADRLQLGDETFLHPLADSARASYRYVSGDTVRIELPALGREIVMAEIRFAPRRADFHLLAGSLWFDTASAALIRAVFRPSRDFNLELDAPEDAGDVPGLLKPIVVEVETMAVEYGLYELQWWLAHRVRFEGVVRVAGLASVPVVLETVAEDVEVGGRRLDPEANPPAGWRRIVEHDGTASDTDTTESGRVRRPPPNRRIVYVPPEDSLRTSPWLSTEPFTRGSEAFSDAELDWLREQLDEIGTPRQGIAPWTVRPGGWRYNRVEALSGALGTAGPLAAGWGLAARVRLGAADRIPNAEVRLARALGGGRVALRGYSELQAAEERERPFGVTASLSALVLGYDDGQYFRAAGGELAWTEEDGRLRLEGRLFAEHQRPARKRTDVSLANLLGEADLPANLEAERIDVYGASGRLRLQSGLDPDGWIGLASVWGEAATGDRAYARLAASLGVSRPIVGRLSGAAEAQAGTTWGEVPVQRLWLLGGPASLRAFPGGSIRGPAFWLARGEVAYGLPAVRLIGFTDLGWAGERSAFAAGRAAVSAGLGVSALDGLLRVDVARVVRGRSPERIRVHVYVDGLL